MSTKLCNSLHSPLLFLLVLVGVAEFLRQSHLTPPDIIPTPNANLPGSQPIYPTANEHHMARQPLTYLNDELSRTKGQSSIAQRSKHELMAYLNPDVTTDL